MNRLGFLQLDYRYQVGVVIALVVLGLGIRSYATRNIEDTDNATVQCDLIDVVSEVNGVIEKVSFKDDQWVDQASVVIEIDDNLFYSELKKSESALLIQQSIYKEALNNVNLLDIEIERDLQKNHTDFDSSVSIFKSTEASIEEARQELESSTADLSYLKENYENISTLFEKKVASKIEHTNSKRLYESKLAMRSSLESKINRMANLRDSEKTKVLTTKKNLQAFEKSKQSMLENAQVKAETAKAAVGVAQAEYDLANLKMERTKIKAKRSGYISNRRTSSGDYVEIGQPIASIVSCQDQPWIQANFKETQIRDMAQGQTAEITIDTYPGVKFNGVLESISSGSGSTFSVLPPENASGNFTKVVKRMPVKISIKTPKDAIFRIGASARVKIFTH
jgi:membrane fusion protein, multidrug efflux system